MTVLPIQLASLGPVLPGEKDAPNPLTALARIIASRTTESSADPAATCRPPRAVPVHEMSDELLLSEYLEGNRDAFSALMQRYSSELLHFLIRFLGSRAAADDVFQETFLQIHLSAETFDTSRRFKPWLFTIAANKARDYHRKQGRHKGLSLSASISGDDGERFVDLLEADLPTPQAPIADAERSTLVKDVIDGMPTHLREILLLSYFQRLSYGQIAEALGIPLGTVKSRLHAAVANFAEGWKTARASNPQRTEG